MTAAPAQVHAVGGVRPFEPADLPTIVALRRRIFRNSERPSLPSLTAYCDEMFCHPAAENGVSPSLVHTDGDGRVNGFLGVLPRQMRIRDELISVAVATQFMVDPAHRGLAGRSLARAFFDGPQALSLSDVANDAARRLWESLGAQTSTFHSLTWTLVLRPWVARARAAAPGGIGLPSRIARFGSRALGTLADRSIGRAPPTPTGTILLPLDPLVVATAATELFRGRELKPAYDPASLAWLWRKCAEKRLFGELDGAMVCGVGGEILGWFLYYYDVTGSGQLLQLAAKVRAEAQVLDHLAHHAWERGGVTITGRLDPGLVAEIGRRKCTIRHEGPWTVVHSRRPELIHAVLRGDAYLSRLEGEWWMSF